MPVEIGNLVIPDSQPESRALSGLGSRSDILWLAAISSTLLLTLLPFSSYIASIPFVSDEWGMTNSQAAIVFSAYLVGYAIASVALLPLTDRLPAGRVLLASMAVIALSNLLFPLVARDVWTASMLRLLAGAGYVGAYIPGIRLVSLRFAGSARGTAVSIFVGAGYAGTTLYYVFMGQLLGATDNWRTAYLITSLVGLAGVAIALLLLRRGRSGAAGPRTAGPPHTPAPADAADQRCLRPAHCRAIPRSTVASVAFGRIVPSPLPGSESEESVRPDCEFSAVDRRQQCRCPGSHLVWFHVHDWNCRCVRRWRDVRQIRSDRRRRIDLRRLRCDIVRCRLAVGIRPLHPDSGRIHLWVRHRRRLGDLLDGRHGVGSSPYDWINTGRPELCRILRGCSGPGARRRPAGRVPRGRRMDLGVRIQWTARRDWAGCAGAAETTPGCYEHGGRPPIAPSKLIATVVSFC